MANLNVGSLGDYIREQRRQAQISLRQLAETAGISNPYLSQIERGLRKPSAEILQQLAKGLRISAEALYVQAGILEDRESDTDVPAAVRADVALSERQKQVLLEVYDSFRKEDGGTRGPTPQQGRTPSDRGNGAAHGAERSAGGQKSTTSKQKRKDTTS
ncbi:MAG: helix-turn-helix domain-containing protein [Streptosporangiaceae bacterium]